MTHGKRKGGLITFIVLLCLLGLLWTQKWNIYDSLRLRNYQPSAQIVQLASDTTMSERGRHLFYVYHPELDQKETFNNNCKGNERTIVLGCYVPGIGIYIYDVTDPRLQGITQVTSAHEMLHAAYGRLSSSDKTKIDDLLNQTYNKLDDQRIKDNIEDYRKNGADVTNELHSILGTEVRNLPPELEQYYTRYFSSRAKIVDYSEKYEQVFTQRKQQVTADDQKLQALKKQIEQDQDALAGQKAAIDSDHSRLEALLAAKQYEAYNQGVPGFNAQVNAYNAQVRHIGQLIDQYNALVAERNAIASEESELIKAIDSRPDTVPSQ